MPKPRKLLVDLDATSTYHCVNRCVRRAFLLGDDPLTGRNFDHRKQWVAERIEKLSGIFAAGVCSYGLMSNHMHLVLRIEPEMAMAWDPDDVMERYAGLFEKTVARAKKLPAELLRERIGVWRERLYSLSWFMRCLSEDIARRANREDGCTGRYWEGRFKSQALLDDAALVTCMAYVDLNPIRANLADTLEDSDFTSIQARLVAAARRPDLDPRDRWLVPFAEEKQPEEPLVITPRAEASTEAETTVEPLPVTLDEYKEILLATIEGLRSSQARAQSSDPIDAPSIETGWCSQAARAVLKRLGLNAAAWVDAMRDFRERFSTMIGSAERIKAESKRRGYKRRPDLKGVGTLYDASD